jgi:protein Mpv17
MIWPAVQFINFCFVPLLLRVPFVSGVSVFWNAYLSYLNSRRTSKVDLLTDEKIV